MLFLGEGMQFKVFCAGTRVLRIPTSHEEIARKFRVKEPEVATRKPHFVQHVVDYYRRTRRAGMEVARAGFLDSALLADPRFEPDEGMSQERIIPLDGILKKCAADGDFDRLNRLLDGVVHCVLSLWDAGVSEITFSPDKYGIDRNGRVVLYDFFEITHVAADVLFLLGIRWWRHTNRSLSEPLLGILVKRFEKDLTPATFRRRFRPNAHLDHTLQDGTMIDSIRQYTDIIRQTNQGILSWNHSHTEHPLT